MAAQTLAVVQEASRGCWNKLACNVVRILSVDGTVRNQMKFWIGSKHPNVFSYSMLLVLPSVSTEAQYMRYVTYPINSNQL